MDLGLPALHVSYSTHWRSISLNPFCAFQGSCSTRCGSGKEGTFKEGEFEGQELNSQPRRRHAARGCTAGQGTFHFADSMEFEGLWHKSAVVGPLPQTTLQR